MLIADDTGFLEKGGERRADALIAAVPPRSWQTISAVAGAHGWREYDWARIPVRTGWRPGRGHGCWPAARSATRPAYYACYGPGRSSTADLAWVQAPCHIAEGAWPWWGWPSGDGRYGFVSTALSKKDATAPFASSGAFGLVLHWPLCLPDVYLGTSPAP